MLYLVASAEGAARYGGEIGDTVDLTLAEEEARAVICAGWIEETKTKKEA